jgi:Uma2 family endonuclease
MSTAKIETHYTPADLLVMPDEGRYELLDGVVVERNMGARSSFVAGNLLLLVKSFCDTQSKGLVFLPDCGYQIFGSDSNRVRFADGSFIRSGRLPDDRPPAGYIRINPDLVIEVISPNDTAQLLEDKVHEWLAAGVELVWVLYPDTKHIYVYCQDGKIMKLSGDDELSGEHVLPGFCCATSDVFVGV